MWATGTPADRQAPHGWTSDAARYWSISTASRHGPRRRSPRRRSPPNRTHTRRRSGALATSAVIAGSLHGKVRRRLQHLGAPCRRRRGQSGHRPGDVRRVATRRMPIAVQRGIAESAQSVLSRSARTQAASRRPDSPLLCSCDQTSLSDIMVTRCCLWSGCGLFPILLSSCGLPWSQRGCDWQSCWVRATIRVRSVNGQEGHRD